MSAARAEAIRALVVTTRSQREDAYDIRRRVFQDEQGVSAEEEFDADDERAIHVLATVDEEPAGTGRVVLHPAYAKIGRMAVLKPFRRSGVGRAVLNELMRVALAEHATHFVLHAQVHALPFYAALGFRAVGPAFDEAGIPHRRMERVVTGERSQ